MNASPRAPGAWLAAALALALLVPPCPAQVDDFDEVLTEISTWGAVSSIVETDPEDPDEGQIVGFFLNTDEGESYEIVLDDVGRALAREASDRTDVLVEVEGVLSVDETLITVRHFAIHFIDPYDEFVDEESQEP